MQNEFLTINWFKDFAKGLIKVNLSSDKKITYNEFTQLKIAKSFNGKFNHKFFLNSVKVNALMKDIPLMQNQIELYYIDFDGVKICGDTEIPSKGCDKKYKLYAIFSFYKKTIEETILIHQEEYEFSSTTIHFDDNIDYEHKEKEISATFTFRGERKNGYLIIKQNPNQIKGWRQIGETLKNIYINSSLKEFPRSGGTIELKCTKESELLYAQEDACGNILAYSSVTNSIQDVTKETKFKILETQNFSCKENKITASPQDYISDKRKCTIEALFGGLTAFLSLEQRGGKVINYKYDLRFVEGKTRELLYVAENSLPTSFQTQLYASKKMYVDGEFISEINNLDLDVFSDNPWIKVSKTNTNIIHIHIDINDDIIYDREGEVTVSDGCTTLKVKIIQPSAKVSAQPIYELKSAIPKHINISQLNKTESKIYASVLQKYENGKETKSPIDSELEYYITEGESFVTIRTIEKCDFIGNYLVKFDVVNDNFKECKMTFLIWCGDSEKITVTTKFINDLHSQYIPIEVIVKAQSQINDDSNVIFKNNRLIINQLTEYRLQNGWLCKYFNEDTLFKGVIDMKVGNAYKFNVNLSSQEKDYNIEEEYVIEEDDEGIDLIVDI